MTIKIATGRVVEDEPAGMTTVDVNGKLFDIPTEVWLEIVAAREALAAIHAMLDPGKGVIAPANARARARAALARLTGDTNANV